MEHVRGWRQLHSCSCVASVFVTECFASGTGQVMPQDYANQLRGLKPRGGSSITAAVGDPVDVVDLLEEYHVGAARRAELRAASRSGRCGVVPPDLPVARLSQDGGLVTTHTNRFGVKVPAYAEQPLTVKPPDHATLPEDEAVVEEKFRLQLYSKICDRLWAGIHGAEVRVREYRRSVLGLSAVDDAYEYVSDRKTSVPQLKFGGDDDKVAPHVGDGSDDSNRRQ